jgi:hypothetical protein
MAGGPLSGVQLVPQTAHGLDTTRRSASTDFRAISKISGEMMGSAIGFFFIPVFTIAHSFGLKGRFAAFTYIVAIPARNLYRYISAYHRLATKARTQC